MTTSSAGSSPRKRRREFAALVLAFFFLCHSQKSHSGTDRSTVIVFHSYHKGLSWTDNVTLGIEETLLSAIPDAAIRLEYMDAKRIADEEHLRNLYSLYRHKLKGLTHDVAIASDDVAFEFLLKYRDELLPHTPLVFCGLNYFAESMLEGHDSITGVVEATDIETTIDIALKMHPKIGQIFVVNDLTATAISMKKSLEGIEAKYPDVYFVFLEDLTMEELRYSVSWLPEDSILLMLVFNRDREGRFYTYEESLALVAEEAKVPIYGLWDFYLGRGIVGGMLTSGYHQGELAANLALRILSGKKASDIPVVKKSPNRFMFDYLQLRRFGLKVSSLPDGSIIINKPVSLYEEHKKLVLGVIGSIAVLVGIILTLSFNIIQRKRAEEELKASRKRYKDLADFLPETIYETDEKGTVVFLNRSGFKAFDYVEEDVQGGLNVLELFVLEDRARVKEDLRRILAGSKFGANEYWAQRKDGTTFPVLVHSTLVGFGDKPSGLRGIAVDITERKRREVELGKLADGVAHQVRNPVTTIGGFARRMQKQCSPNDPARDPLGIILAEVQRLERMVSDIHRHTSLPQPELRPTSLPDVVERVLSGARGLGPAGRIRVRRQFSAQGAEVLADGKLLELALGNIVLNVTEAVGAEGELDVTVAPEGEWVCVCVKDTGVGISAEDLPHVFDPFFSSKPRASGLGLTTASRVVADHKGRIEINSTPGVGTEVRVCLPPARLLGSP